MIMNNNVCDFHDADVFSIEIDKKKTDIFIKCRLESEDEYQLVFEGFSIFRAEDIKFQNIIYQILRSSKNDFTEEQLIYWIIWGAGFSDGSSWVTPETAKKIANSCLNKEIELFLFQPSIGAQIAIACKKLNIEKIEFS
jgi:hypothetical protein